MENALAWLVEDPKGVQLLAAAALATAAACGFGLGFAVARSGTARARDAFAAVAAECLRHNSEGFLALASERFSGLHRSAESDLEVRRAAIEALVEPLREALAGYRSEARELERSHSLATGRLDRQLRSLAEETSKLAGALKAPAARGRWGELTLRRTAELAGLSAHCDFDEQVSLLTDSGARRRPDMIVRLPGDREIAVDAKAPLDAYLEACEGSEAERADALVRHARQIRRHVDDLAGRDYAACLERTPAFVVLFLPDEGILAGGVAHDRALVEDALAKGVVLATPASLYALLRAVAEGWREARLTENTRHVLAHARELDDRLAGFVEHLGRVGGALGRCVDAFNAAVGSLDARVLPQARRMRELGVDGRRDLDAPEPIDSGVRETGQPAERTTG